MSAFEPQRIRRIGVAVEMESGELMTFYSETPCAEMQVETHVETARFREGPETRVLIVDSSTDITITGIRELNVTTRAIEATAQAIENAKAITEGNEK
ncbi:hypothetical protein [Glutamicibacter arilaitensis]|uniref:hypothetical protein n=1 Tax=Glutamicibacter arilaitensis TaxID=256701 RepID=UPI003FD6B1E6